MFEKTITIVSGVVESSLGALLDKISYPSCYSLLQPNLSVNNLSKKTNLFFLSFVRVCCQFGSIRCEAFTDLTAVDNLVGVIKGGILSRFVIIYFLLSVYNNMRLLIGTDWSFRAFIRSTNHLFLGVTWAEREVFDLFGVVFWGSTDLRRILTDYGFLGFPLQKDFPVCGLVELSFSDEVGSLSYVPISFPQRYRLFKLISTYNGRN